MTNIQRKTHGNDKLVFGKLKKTFSLISVVGHEETETSKHLRSADVSTVERVTSQSALQSLLGSRY